MGRGRTERTKRFRAFVAYALGAIAVACSQISYVLTVSTTGTGSGTFNSTGANLSCSNTITGHLSCTLVYVPSRDEGPAPTVTVSAVAAADSRFLGWSGICSGTDSCTTTVDSEKKLSAEFIKIDYGTFTKTDGNGNSFIAGTFYSSKTLGSTNLISAGDVDVFIAKYASGSTTPSWATRIGGAGIDYVQDMNLDSNGDLVIRITAREKVSLSGVDYTCLDPFQTLIVKLSGNDGTNTWSRCLTQ